jgi:hypothetical protein
MLLYNHQPSNSPTVEANSHCQSSRLMWHNQAAREWQHPCIVSLLFFIKRPKRNQNLVKIITDCQGWLKTPNTPACVDARKICLSGFKIYGQIFQTC